MIKTVAFKDVQLITKTNKIAELFLEIQAICYFEALACLTKNVKIKNHMI